MKYLYYYNCGIGKEYKRMFYEVEDAIYKWNGSPKKHYIYLNEKLENFNVAEQLKIKATNKKGMCEKLALSLTLSRRSKLYILDEPISGVDPVTREKIIDCILDRIDGKYNKYNKV